MSVPKIGEIFKAVNGQNFKLIKYESFNNCVIMFDDGTVVEDVNMGNIKKGYIKNPNFKSLYNIGYIGIGKYKLSEDYSKNVAGIRWHKIMSRCYSESYPTYKDVTVCEEWHNFQNFAAWFEENYDPEVMEGWHLDKDIICKDCKIYSPETCAFVPQEINKLFIKSKSRRGELPIGVRQVKGGKFGAYFTKNNRQVYLGRYESPISAFDAYKSAKEKRIKELAEVWKEKIDFKLYEAMINHKVTIND